jgi:fibronectin type 3 domain-containing protein
LESWIASRNYPALFTEAFGDDAVTPGRIIMAIATYERTLVSNQAPIDAFIAGNQDALTAQERLGMQLFGQNQCATCHTGNRFTDDRFHYIGVRPPAEDQGRFLVTGNNGDRGRMRTPGLRNASLRGEFMHNGRLASLGEVVEFYNRGGDFDAPNKDNNVRPLNLTETEKEALIAFLGRPLTDPRVAAETGPFSRPALFADSANAPLVGTDTVDLISGQTPSMVVIEPALAGNPNFTIGLTAVPAGQGATLVIDDAPIASGAGIPGAGEVKMRFELNTLGELNEDGYLSQAIRIPGGSALVGKTLYGKWFVTDGPGPAESASFSATLFGSSAGLLPAPAGVTASDNESTTAVTVSWEEVPTADGYDVYRSSTSFFDDASLVKTTEATSFTDTDVSADRLYNYWVVAFHDNEASPPSAAEPGSTYDLSGFEFTASDFLSDRETLLSWTALPAASGYLVLRGDTSSPSSMTQIDSLEAVTSTRDSTGTAARTYFYRVVAVNGEGNEIATSEIDSGGKSLSIPTDVTATMATFQDRIELSWTSVEGATGYRVYRSSTASPGTSIAVISSNSWSDTTAVPGSYYYYEIAAENDYGSSARSSRAQGSRGVSAPTGLTAITEPGRIALSWTASSGVTEYAVFRSTTDRLSSAIEIGTSSIPSYFDETAEAGEGYYYLIASINELNERVVEESNAVSGTSGFTAPDLLVGKRAGSLMGNSIYNASGMAQTLISRTRRYRKSTAFVAAQNDGNTEDVLRYAGGGGNRFFKVSYYRSAPTPANLTAAAKVGAALSTDLEAGVTERLQIKTKPVRSRQSRNRAYRLTTILRAVSTVENSEQDCIKVKTLAKH